MADPVTTTLASGNSAVASTTVNFTAPAAGALMTLHITGDDYASANPSGWSLAQNQNSGFHGSVFWYKFSSGAETSVVYVIGSAVRSTFVLLAHTNVDNAAGLVISAKQNVDGGGGSTASTPSVTPVTGMPARVLAIGQTGFSNSGGLFTTIGTWASSYVAAQNAFTVANPGEATGTATLVFDATGSNSTSTSAVVDGAPQAFSGIIAVFKVAVAAVASGSMLLPAPVCGPGSHGPLSWQWVQRSGVDGVVGTGDIFVNAEVAAVGTAANDAAVTLSPNAENAVVATAANNPTLGMGLAAEVAAVAADALFDPGSEIFLDIILTAPIPVDVVANDATFGLAPNAEAAGVTAVANAPTAAQTVNAENAGVTAAANVPTPTISVNAENALVTVTANDATVTIGADINVNAEVAAVTATANDATLSASVAAGNAPVASQANDPTTALLVNAEAAAVTVLANAPSPNIGALPSAADVAAVANNSTITLSIASEAAAVTVTANNPTLSTGGSGPYAMATLSQDAEVLNLEWIAGDPISLAITVQGVDWSGTYRAQIRTQADVNSTLIGTLTVTATYTAPDTAITMTMTAVLSAGIPPGAYYWDLQQNAGPTRLRGTVSVRGEVTV